MIVVAGGNTQRSFKIIPSWSSEFFEEWIRKITLIPWEKLLLLLKSILFESYLVKYSAASFRFFIVNIYL